MPYIYLSIHLGLLYYACTFVSVLLPVSSDVTSGCVVILGTTIHFRLYAVTMTLLIY